jgi:queuosine precursor transporter
MLSFEPVISFLNHGLPDCVALIELFVCLIFILSMLRFFGVVGLYAYVAVALIAANIQVLKGGQFIFPFHPIAMGTLLFGTIALVFDIITEYFDKEAALKGVRLGFCVLCLFSVLMVLTIGVRPLDPKYLTSDSLALYQNHEHMKALFMPMPSILLASLISYLTSQYSDVLLFRLIKRWTHEKWLWLRAILSTSLSAWIDTCLFSLLAWKLLSPTPVSWETLISIYILGTYPLRLLCSFSLTPIIYFARFFLPKL